jgi:hypothetical protein
MYIKFKENFITAKHYITVKRCLINKDITLYNILSTCLFFFLICMTFEKANAHRQFGDHCIDIFANCHEFRGTYSYRQIAKEFGLTNTLKKFAYINRVMKREPHNKIILLVFKLKDTVFRYLLTIKYKGRPIKRQFESLNRKFF